VCSSDLLFSGVLLLDKVFDLVDLLVNKGVSLAISLKIFLLFLPTIFSLSIPMSLLLACLLTFGRLSEDHEITALRASGLSFHQILWPPAVVALIFSAALIPFNTTLAPMAMSQFRTLTHKIAATDPLLKIEPRRFTNVQNIRLYAGWVSPDRKVLQNVWIFQNFKQYGQRVFADRGTARVSDDRLTLRLENGQLERFSYDAPSDFMHTEFQRFDLTASFANSAGERNRSWREFRIEQLRAEKARRRSLGRSVREIDAELHLRFAIAFAPLAFALIGMPLGVALERGGRGVGFSASLGVIFLYYLLLMLGQNVAERGILPAPIGLWIGNATLALVGVFLYQQRLRN
jgi:LPS export ABC transporter permease LptF